MDRKRILVVGATGAQGGSVARHLLQTNKYQIRCISRRPEGDAAKALQQAGAEVVGGELADPQSLKAALRDCWGVFGVTNFWEHFEAEYQHGVNLIDAVAEAGIEYLILSTLPSVEKISGGKLAAPHFDLKAKLEEYARRKQPKSAFVHVAFYYENYLNFTPPRRQEDGSFAFGFPQGETPLAMVAVEDVGGVVAPMFDRPEAFVGKVTGVVGDDQPASEYAAIMSRVLGERIVYNNIPMKVFASFGFPGAEDLANMFEFNRVYIPNRQADLQRSRELYPSIRTFAQWMEQNADKFRPVLDKAG